MRKTRLNRARLQPQAVRVASAALGIVLAMMLAPPEAAARNVPTAPLNLMADPITSTHIYVTWDLPATTNGTITHYIIEYRDPSTWSELVDTSSPENSWRVPIPVQTQEPPCGTSAVLTTTCATTEALA